MKLESDHNDSSNSSDTFEKLKEAQTKLEEIRKEYIKGLFARTKLKWIEYGEKPTKYFLSLEKRNYINKTVNKLVTANGVVTGQSDILSEIERFYKALYSCGDNNLYDVELESIISTEHINVLDSNAAKELEGLISKEEALLALKNMKNNKSPGSDGFTVEFYKFFWKDLGIFLIRSLNYGFLSGELSLTQKQENIAFGKPAWQDNPFSTHSGKSDYISENAVDGRKTDFSGKQCAVSQGRKNNATWRVDLGAIRGIDHIRIYYRTGGAAWDNGNGHASRFLGFSVYISNTTEKSDGVLCFKDATFTKATIPAVVTLNCTHYGRYVIYYNERKPTDPPYYSQFAHVELCEFEVYGCSSPEYFGEKCSRCPSNCLDNRCHIASGHCFICDDGYQGNECEQPCQNSTYGRQCSKVCGKCRDGQQCDHTSGICYMGCDLGYFGSTCHQESAIRVSSGKIWSKLQDRVQC
ncbi:uncharacterized protein LOC133174502 [Saccostrea echinata]|uniref:uncharacterized protein LOC133174502 n=1 Tax=Saccostrea echinata TaxID=191078 RepID=UPI002A80509C|nr:uncharacterized protein LOC133174502 [Saccostrea echinata]